MSAGLPTIRRTEPTREAWHAPDNGRAAHYHDRLGVPTCGAGWFTGRRLEAQPAQACKRCAALLARASRAQ